MNSIHKKMQYIAFIVVVVSISMFASFESLYAQQLVQPNEKIDWQKEEQVCARYQASCRYAEQVLSNENWSSEKQAKWGAQLIWYTLKGIRMSGVRHTAYFHYATSHLNENQMSEEEKRNLDWEVEAFSRICDEISKMESQLMKLMESYDAKWKVNDKKAKQIWSLNKANCLLMATDEYRPSLVTDAWFDNKSYLHEAHRALYYCFKYNRETAAIHYKKAIQGGMPELENRAKVARVEYDVTEDMHRAVALLKEANSLLESVSEQRREKLDDIFAELLRVHERISYTPTIHLSTTFCQAWFAEYSGELDKLRHYSENHSLGNPTPLILEKDNLLFLYFIAL